MTFFKQFEVKIHPIDLKISGQLACQNDIFQTVEVKICLKVLHEVLVLILIWCKLRVCNFVSGHFAHCKSIDRFKSLVSQVPFTMPIELKAIFF